jgi:hypothetical protein
MHILIQNNLTQEYLTPAGEWSKHLPDGEIFLSTNLALNAVNQVTRGNLNLIFLDLQAKPYLKIVYH